jgi:epoxyqueuosine reductase
VADGKRSRQALSKANLREDRGEVTTASTALARSIEQAIKQEARRLGFVLAGVTTPDPPSHLSVFENWLAEGRHATMAYLAHERSRARRADPAHIMPGCKSIVVLAIPYSKPQDARGNSSRDDDAATVRGRVAAYAWGEDYHLVLKPRLEAMVDFIQMTVGHPVASLWYTDTGPILERELAQRAGLGWIGKNTCLINPKNGSYLLLAEILLNVSLTPDAPFVDDRCGSCARCIEACPTDCILPNRTIDARRCISYLTIELRDDIPGEFRDPVHSWILGCDVCQMACPWNRFAPGDGDAALAPAADRAAPLLVDELCCSPDEFNNRFRKSAVRRAGYRGYRRNLAVALGNTAGPEALPALEKAAVDDDPIVAEHAAWAIRRILERAGEGP